MHANERLFTFFGRCRQNWDPPLLDPIVDPFLDPPSGPLNFYGENKQKYKLKLYNMCASYHHFFCTLVSFDLAFSSKEGVPLHTTHFH